MKLTFSVPFIVGAAAPDDGRLAEKPLAPALILRQETDAIGYW